MTERVEDEGPSTAAPDPEVFHALLRREHELDAIQRSLGWRLLSYYGPYKRRVVVPLWRRVRAFASRWLRPAADAAATPYDEWVAFAERIHDAEAAAMPVATAGVAVSFVVPCEPGPAVGHDAQIASLIAQSHERWQLFVVESREVPGDSPGGDPRIGFVACPRGHAAAAASEAVGRTTAPIVGILAPGAVLARDTVRVVARTFEEAACDVLYTDEDRLEARGGRSDPDLKPGWSPDLLLSRMYWSPVVFYRKAFLLELLPLAGELPRELAYDLALRATERAAVVAHLPRVLVHRGVAPSDEAKHAERRVLAAAVVRRGVAGSIEDAPGPSTHRLRRALPAPGAISIVIPTRDGGAMLERCVRTVEASDHPSFEIVIVDNGSVADETRAYLAASPHRVVRAPGPFNFSRLNNRAVAEHARGRYVLFLNDDTEPCDGDWLRALEEHAQRPEVGAVGGTLLYPDGRLQHAGIALGIGGLAGHPHRGSRVVPEGVRDVSAVTGACLMMRRETFDSVGGFDERLPVNSNDVDLCLRLRRSGYLIVCTPYAVLRHYESQTRGVRAEPDDAWLMRRRWRDELAADPYYNPNLVLADESAALDLTKPDGMVRLYLGARGARGAVALVPGASIGQGFFAPGADLCAVVVYGRLDGQGLDTAMCLTIRETPGAARAVRTVSRSIAGRTGAERWFVFEPIADSAHRLWYARLEAAAGHAVTLERAAAVSDVMGPCYENDRPTHGTLRFDLYAMARCRRATCPP